MPDPRPRPNAADSTDIDTSAPTDATLMPAPGVVTGSFAPPRFPGEIGTLGRFRVLQELGQGGMGAVYLGYDAALERKVALKVMLPVAAADAGARERFLREARAAAKVRSEHVVTIFDVGDARVPFIAMEYLLGHSLDDQLKRRGDLPLAHAVRIGRETALGLAAAHTLGLVHRDVKPANIWLEAPHGRTKLLDFGLARAASDNSHLTASGQVIGTPAYMSPEQARGQKLDHRSDLFSLGAMLYRLCAGKVPFDGSNTMSVLTSLAVDTPRSPRELNARVPAALSSVIMRLLAKNPAERFQTAAEAAGALAAIERTLLGAPLLAVAAQPQRAWEGIEESGAHAPVSDTEVLPSLAHAPAPPRAEAAARRGATPAAPRSRTPMVLALALLVAAAGGAAFYFWPVLLALFATTGTLVVERGDADADAALIVRRGGQVVEKGTRAKELKLDPGAYTVDVAEPVRGRRVEPSSFTLAKGQSVSVRVVSKPKPEPTESDRKTAKFVLDAGGSVTVQTIADGKLTDVSPPATPPDTPFLVVKVNLKGNREVTPEGLAHFRGCQGLARIDLSGSSLTDAGLGQLKGCPALAYLDVQATDVSFEAASGALRWLPQGCRFLSEHNR